VTLVYIGLMVLMMLFGISGQLAGMGAAGM